MPIIICVLTWFLKKFCWFCLYIIVCTYNIDAIFYTYNEIFNGIRFLVLSLRWLRVSFQKPHDVVNDYYCDCVRMTWKVRRMFSIITKIFVTIAKRSIWRSQSVVISGITSIFRLTDIHDLFDLPTTISDYIGIVYFWCTSTPPDWSFDYFCKNNSKKAHVV